MCSETAEVVTSSTAFAALKEIVQSIACRIDRQAGETVEGRDDLGEI